MLIQPPHQPAAVPLVQVESRGHGSGLLRHPPHRHPRQGEVGFNHPPRLFPADAHQGAVAVSGEAFAPPALGWRLLAALGLELDAQADEVAAGDGQVQIRDAGFHALGLHGLGHGYKPVPAIGHGMQQLKLGVALEAGRQAGPLHQGHLLQVLGRAALAAAVEEVELGNGLGHGLQYS